MRLLVDRQQMLDLVFGGFGTLGNDVFGIWAPEYDHSLPQRHQDIDQAKSLLKAAGAEGLHVTLVTSDIAQGTVLAAQVFAQQASEAGVSVSVDDVTVNEFYGTNYLKWPFAQDYWFYNFYLPQVSLATLPSAPFNETHWDNARYNSLYAQAIATVDPALRTEIAQEMQRIEYDQGGYIIPFFPPVIDGFGANVGGLVPSKIGLVAERLRLQGGVAIVTTTATPETENAREPGPRKPHPMRDMLIRRIPIGVLTLVLVSILVFAATQTLPGNAASAVLLNTATPQRLHALEQQMGLNRPAVDAVLDLAHRRAARQLRQVARQRAAGEHPDRRADPELAGPGGPGRRDRHADRRGTRGARRGAPGQRVRPRAVGRRRWPSPRCRNSSWRWSWSSSSPRWSSTGSPRSRCSCRVPRRGRTRENSCSPWRPWSS